MECQQRKHIIIISVLTAAFLLSGCTTNKIKNVETEYTADDRRIKTTNEPANHEFMGYEAASVLGIHVTNFTNEAFAMAGVKPKKLDGRVVYLPNPVRNYASGYREVALGGQVGGMRVEFG